MSESEGSIKNPNQRFIGNHPKTGKPITVYGLNKRPFLKRGLKPLYLPEGEDPHTLTPERAAELFAAPPAPLVLVRAERFPLRPTPEQEVVFLTIGRNLRTVWDAWKERFDEHTDAHFESLYRELEVLNDRAKTLAKREKKEGETAEAKRESKRLAAERKELAARLKAATKEHPYPVELINELNALREDRDLGGVNRNWQEETTKLFLGAYRGYVTSRVNGDYTDRMAGFKDPGEFPGILGRTGFKMHGETFEILAKKLAPDVRLEFPVPDYQRRRISRGQVKAFTVSLDAAGRWWLGINYEMPKPPTKPLEREKGVYLSLGASSIGVLSPKGSESIPFWRSDYHWLPLINSVTAMLAFEGSGTNLHPLTRGSKRWRNLAAARRKMFQIMSRQQKQDRREVALYLIERKLGERLVGHGVHFVVTEYVIRAKKGKLADRTKKERGGDFGLNRAAQSTGMAAFVEWLKEKVLEHGGTVQTIQVPPEARPKGLPKGRENKIAMAHALRDYVLTLQEQQAA